MTHSLLKIGSIGSLAAFLLSACVPPGDGKQAKSDEVYFPVGVLVSEASDHLLVVNSDFDLQFSQGTIQSLRLERVREMLRRPCSADTDCGSSELCDDEPTEANEQVPSYFCVDRADGRPCGELGEKSVSERAVTPGRCSPVELDAPFDGGDSLITDVAETSAFATQAILLSRPCEGDSGLAECTSTDQPRVQSDSGVDAPERLFMPVRGDTTIHFVEVQEDGRLICGRGVEDTNKPYNEAEGEELRCGGAHRIADGTSFEVDSDGVLSDDGSEPPDPRDLSAEELDDLEDDPLEEFRLPPEPMDLAASSDGRVVVVSHQENGRVSSLLNDWKRKPALVHILADQSFNPLGVAALPSPYGDDEAEPDFLLTYRTNPEVALLRFQDDGLLAASRAADGSLESSRGLFRPELNSVGRTPISTNQSGLHSRGLVVDDSLRVAAVEACGTDADCLLGASDTPLDVYVTNRSPNSLVVGRTGGSNTLAKVSELPRFYDSIPLTAGPSRIQMGHVTGVDGEKELRVFVLCFDDGLIYIYDPVRRTVESEIRTGRGPYGIAFDTERAIAFVAHFTDSYVGAVSLDKRHPLTFGATVGTLGVPRPPRASK